MNSIALVGRRLLDWPKGHRPELMLCFRITTSAALTLAVSQLIHLRLALWAVLTSIILTQMSIGKSLKATTDYLAGTLGGAAFAGAVGALIPHNSELSLDVVLAITLVPVALIAVADARFSAAPYTAVIVLLAPTITHLGSIASAFERVIEVAVGCVVGLVVSYAVLPARAYDQTIDAAGHLLRRMANELPKLLGGLARNSDAVAMPHIWEDIGESYARVEMISVDGAQERRAYFGGAPDLAPLLRTLKMLWHDFLVIERLGEVPLPPMVRARLVAPLTRVGYAAADYLRANDAALFGHRHVAPLHAVNAAFDDYAAEMGELRLQDLLQDLPVEAVERIFTLALALEQLRRDFNDLERCVAQHSSAVGRDVDGK